VPSEEGEGEPQGLVEEEGLPDWLVPSEEEGEDETLAPAEIPAWLLALKPPELREKGEPPAPAPIVEEPVEETGLLAGLQGTLPVEMLIAQPRAVTTSPVVEAPVRDTPNSRLFAEIVGRPVEVAPTEVIRPPARLLSLLPQWLIYIALVAVVVLPLVAGEPLLDRQMEPLTGVAEMYEAIDGLGDDARVLVAFDYDPSAVGEMDALARTVVGHLMDRQAGIVALSTLPAGPATAQSLLNDLAAGRPAYADRYGERYANLGYIPGQAAGIRLVSQSLVLAMPRDFQSMPLGELPVLDGVSNVSDFDLVLELAANQETLRWWIEQAGTPYGVPVVAGVSASIEPLARAYYQTDPRQLVGMMGGVPGAASYESLSAAGQTESGDRLAMRLDSQLGGYVVFALVLIVGGIAGLSRREGGGGH
jgi:hypothetical protein